MKPTTIVRRMVLARNITAILQAAVAEMPGRIDPRTLNTVRDLIWAIAVCGATRLKELAQALWKRRRARSVKNTETALSKSLKHAPYDEAALFRACRRQVLRRVPARAYERYRGLPICFLIFWLEEGGEPPILATTLPVRNLLEAQDMLHLYEKRRAIEIGFQQLKGTFGLEKFMVQRWSAVERLLDLVVPAYMILLLLMRDDRPAVQEFLVQARQLLAQQSVWKEVLTVGKLHEALSLSFQEDRSAWLATLG